MVPVDLIDGEGFRANVGIIVCDVRGLLLIGGRIGQNAWQFPQGGVQSGESVEQAMFRELHEEIGLTPRDVEVLGCTRDWLRYRLPEQFIRNNVHPLCIGQKQRWYLLRLTGSRGRAAFRHHHYAGIRPLAMDGLLGAGARGDFLQATGLCAGPA